MNPEYRPERMNDLLSCLLKRKVKVILVLPTDSTRLSDETSLIVMDIVVQLEDGSLANVEMQRIGYLFPGQRSACYSADLLLRQYKRVRDERKKQFSYRDIKCVYTIILFEKSPKQFHLFSDQYYHFFEQKSNTGVSMELLQKYIFIPLDIFHKNLHNKGIEDKLDAWLAVLSEDAPEMIVTISDSYPEFKKIYEEAYDLCCNMEEVMQMFSKELYELDRNTVQYMIDEMQDMIDTQKKIIERSIKNTLIIMQKANMPEEDIKRELMQQYELTHQQAEQYIKEGQ